MTSLQAKWTGIGALLVISLFLLFPSLSWYRRPAAEREKLEMRRERPKWLLNLGLDLKGGTHLLMEIDTSRLDPSEKVDDAVQRAIQIIRNRVDQFGVAEPLIAKQGERWIVVQLPGLSNPQQAKELIGKTALLEFRLVDDSDGGRKVFDKIATLAEGPLQKDGSLHPEIAKLMPPGTVLFPGREDTHYLLKSSVALTGAYLKNALVDTGGQFGFPTVSLRFNPEGAVLFDKLTGANVGKNLAIVLDGVVHTVPVIKSRIGGGTAQIEGNFSMEEARNIALVLRAGALPAPVRIIEERSVGPSAGEDSIRAGTRASLIGVLFLFFFMAVYYKFSGLVANLALALNLVFLLAGMAYFKATLTLPGIAGIILSLSMAVDANVLILERIREELAAGKIVRMAISAGYEKAWSAILDSNVTTWLAALFLFQFGSGPVKGFAVTLTLGLVVGVFTAVVVTRAIYEAWLSSRQSPQTLSI